MTNATRESHILKYENHRAEEFKPNIKLVDLIARLRQVLEPVQLQQNEHFGAPLYPVLVIIGCPRSGTTLLTQILAASGNFAYPTNLLSRFAYAPLVGAMIQQMLFDRDHDYRGEFDDIQSSSSLHSTLGKTSGALGVNEFFHFWRKFFPNHDPGHLTDEELDLVEIARMRSELAAIESVFGKPLVSKGMMMQYNVSFFARRVPELFFIHIKRRPTFVLQSVLMSRRKFYGTDDIWWSVKPKEYEWLVEMDPIRQVAGQVLFTETAIDEQLASVDSKRKIVCTYEELCDDPQSFYEELRTKLSLCGHEVSGYHLKESLHCNNTIRLSSSEIRQLEAAYTELQSRAADNRQGI